MCFVAFRVKSVCVLLLLRLSIPLFRDCYCRLATCMSAALTTVLSAMSFFGTMTLHHVSGPRAAHTAFSNTYIWLLNAADAKDVQAVFNAGRGGAAALKPQLASAAWTSLMVYTSLTAMHVSAMLLLFKATTANVHSELAAALRCKDGTAAAGAGARGETKRHRGNDDQAPGAGQQDGDPAQREQQGKHAASGVRGDDPDANQGPRAVYATLPVQRIKLSLWVAFCTCVAGVCEALQALKVVAAADPDTPMDTNRLVLLALCSKARLASQALSALILARLFQLYFAPDLFRFVPSVASRGQHPCVRLASAVLRLRCVAASCTCFFFLRLFASGCLSRFVVSLRFAHRTFFAHFALLTLLQLVGRINPCDAADFECRRRRDDLGCADGA